ncbi:sugar phosphate isomerase/epimerase family protein [Saccharopolyspora cebuensis]|uniref:Sugar phosphate isomerase/epimerase family protein n=1 Tax=Saccharopolyspora cebuensis TaxID=418759 RepID=A0ABV4CAA8_9PSEU
MPVDPPPRALAGIGDEAATSVAGQIAAIQRLGWRHVELRSVDGTALADLTDAAFARVRTALRDAGLDVVCAASRIGNWARPVTAPFADDLHELDVLADRCGALGTRYVRIMSYPDGGLAPDDWRDRVLDRTARLAERAARRGVVLLHENCAGWAGADADRMRQLLDAADGLGLLFDTGNGVDHGYDAAELLPPLLPHVAHVHVKDAVGGPGQARYVLPGDGSARVADCLRLLLDSGYTGALSLEPHLATRPHDGVRAEDAEPFVRAGRRLEALLHELAGSVPA